MTRSHTRVRRPDIFAWWRQATAVRALSSVVALSTLAPFAPARASGPMSIVELSPLAGIQHNVGDTRAYQLSSSGHTEVDFAVLAKSLSSGLGNINTQVATAPRTRSEYTISATLHSRVVAADSTGAIITMRLSSVDARFDDSIDARSDLLEAPFLMTVAADGSIHSIKFPKGYPDSLARIVRGLVAPLAVVVPADSARTWNVTDVTADASNVGLFESRYEVTGDVSNGISLKRTRTPVRLANADQVQRGSATSTLVVERETGALQKLELAEDVTTHEGNTFVGRHVGRMTATSVEVSDELPTTLAEAESILADDSFARARLYDVEPHLAPRVEGLTTPAILGTFESEVAKNQAAGHVLLKNYVRRYPASAGEILSALSARPTESDDPIVVIGFAAVASAGHFEAQEALVHALTAPDSSPRTIERAIISMMDLAMPEPFVLDAVWATRNRFAAMGQKLALSVSLATNVFGALGDIARDNPEITETVLATLSSSLQTAKDKFEQMLAIDGLANIGDFDRVSPLVAPYFASPEGSVRTSAFVTFRRMSGEAAFAQFAERFAAEKDPHVLHEAAIVARDMAPTAAKNAWAKAQVKTTNHTEVRITLVRLLGESIANHPENTAVLRDLLGTTTERKVRREIYAFVSPVVTEGGHQ